MDLLKPLKMILRFTRTGARWPNMETKKMALERYASHLEWRMKGCTYRFRYMPLKSHAERRKAQSRMDRTAHTLFVTKIKLASMF